jgi:hypothetical protein
VARLGSPQAPCTASDPPLLRYEGLRKKGMSKQRAASIANSEGSSSRRGKKSGKGSGGSKSRQRAAGREGGKKSGSKS